MAKTEELHKQTGATPLGRRMTFGPPSLPPGLRAFFELFLPLLVRWIRDGGSSFVRTNVVYDVIGATDPDVTKGRGPIMLLFRSNRRRGRDLRSGSGSLARGLGRSNGRRGRDLRSGSGSLARGLGRSNGRRGRDLRSGSGSLACDLGRRGSRPSAPKHAYQYGPTRQSAEEQNL